MKIISIMFCFLILVGCQQEDVKTSTSLATVMVTSAELAAEWTEVREKLVMYREQLGGSPDGVVLGQIILNGDQTVAQLTHPDNLDEVYSLMSMAFKQGQILYEKYSKYLTPEERATAERLYSQWQTIQKNISYLKEEKNKTKRYLKAKEAAEITFKVANDIVLPIFHAIR